MDRPSTPRTTVRQKPQRGHYDPQTIMAILDEGLVCHVAFVADGSPVVIPTGYAVDGDRVLLHGGVASRLLGVLGEGAEVSIAVTLVDGIVLADAAFRHSMNYRSVVLFGRATAITDPDLKILAMRAFTEHIVPGRWDDLPPPTAQEINATAVVEVPIDEVSAKVRTGPPIAGPVSPKEGLWRGVANFTTTVAGYTPVEDSVTEVPAYLRAYRRPFSRR
jgi:nitroimidazol reductase NimA-like FMN-containing flavoprotein (pyridoxamine 5'-phosphate oxidase superfamily)